MRNRFLGLLFAGMALFSACGDDDDDKKGGAADLNGLYATSSAENVLELTYSGAALLGKSVDFNSVDGETATLTLQGVVPGEAETVLAGLALTTDGDVYSFSATDEKETRTLSLSGTLRQGRLALDVNVAFVPNELTGTWDLKETQNVRLVWKVDTENGNYTLVTLPGVVCDLTTGLLATIAPSFLGDMVSGYLRDVTFREDGNVVATYNAARATDENPEPAAEWVSSPLNLAHYAVKDGVCRLYLNVEMIMAQAAADARSAAADPVTSLLGQLLGEGIPVHFEVAPATETAGEQLSVYLDEEFLKRLSPLLQFVGGLIDPEMTFEIDAPLVGTIAVPVLELVNNLPGALDVTTEMEAGLNFVAREAAE